MSKLNIAPIVSVLVLISGCANVPYNYEPEAFDFSEPPIDLVTIAYVGDELLRMGTYQISDAIVLNEEIRFGLFGEEYTLGPGEYIKHGEDEIAGYFDIGASQRPGRIRPCRFCNASKSIMVYKEQPKMCIVSETNVTVCENDLLFERTQVPVIKDDTLQQTLILRRSAIDKVIIEYRAYYENLARPVLEEEAEFDLSESNTIRHKGAQLEILEAKNEYVKYKVVKVIGRNEAQSANAKR